MRPSGTSCCHPASARDRSLIGAELKPGARAVVRGAAIFVDTTGTAQSLDDADATAGFSEAADQGFPTTPPVAVWTPGQPSVVNDGAGYLLPAGADIVVRIHYKKTWITEGMDFADQSQIGLHFADGDRGHDRVDARRFTGRCQRA